MKSLDTLLSRARERIALQELKKFRERTISQKKALDARIAEDYAARLAEKSRIRKLVEAPERDGERFRFYFSRIYGGHMLYEVRKMIDEEIQRAEDASPKAAPTSRLRPNVSHS